MLKAQFDKLVESVKQAVAAHYGERLVSLAVFGSVARGTVRPDSDIDLLLVATDLPRGRLARMREFDVVEDAVAGNLAQAAAQGVTTSLSPVLKTPEEVRHGSPLFLDMTREVLILTDRENFLHDYLDDLDRRLRDMGARRLRKGGGYYWLLKPDLRPGEDIRL